MNILRNGERVAGATQGNQDFGGSISLNFKDTPDIESEYFIRVRTRRESRSDSRIQRFGLGIGVQISD